VSSTAHVAQLAERGDRLLTSDPADMRLLLGDRARHVALINA
jgi:hypothetical protein